MATLEELTVRLGVDSAPLARGLKAATATTEQQAQRMQAAFHGVNDAARTLGAVLATYASFSYFKGIVDGVDRLNDLSNQLDVSTEALSAFSYAAKLSGTTLESVAQGLRFLGNNVSDAAANTGTAGEALKALGLNAKELINLPLDQQFEKVSEALKGVSNQGDKISYVRDIFGRMGADLLPLIDDFKELKEEAIAVGYIVGDETAQRFAILNDEIDRMKLGSEVLAKNFLSLLVPALNDTLAGVNELFAGLENTSKLFNSLAASGISLGARLGLVDKDVADEALLIAGENIRTGEARRTPKPSGRGTGAAPSTRTEKDKKDKKEKEPEDYDKAGDALSDYLAKQQQELELAQLTGKALAVRRAELEATGAAIKEGNLPSREMIDLLKETAGATYDAEQATKKLTDAQEEAKRFQGELKDKLSETLSGIVLDFDNAADAAARFAEAIAKMVIEKKITGPLADSLSSAIDTSGLGKGIGDFFGGFFAAGGAPPMGKFSVVGENGPELFVPKTSGTIVPNDALGGGITVNHSFNFSSGVQKSDIAALIPQIVQMSKNATFDAITRGGAESRLVGRRS